MGFSEEILSKTAKHTKNKSEINSSPPPTTAAEQSPAAAVQKWFSNILKQPNGTLSSPNPDPNPAVHSDPTSPTHTNNNASALPPRLSIHRKSRFQTDASATQQHPIPPPTNFPAKRTFKNIPPSTATNLPSFLDKPLLSPPKHLVESAHRRSISSTTCSVPDSQVLSPPRNLVESAHRRSISCSTCSTDKIFQRSNGDHGQQKAADSKGQELNAFLKEKKLVTAKILSGEINAKAKIVLSGPSNSTSSMVAAICYAWLLENKMSANGEGGDREGSPMEMVVPLMNMRRGKMWRQKQAAWLFHHVGLDASALLFSNEVDLEALMMAKQLSLIVVGQDILKTNGEVGSGCTILTDHFCEDAYDLLQIPMVKKLLLAGILLDTENLNIATKMSMTRDSEAVQLLSAGSAPNYRNTLYDQLMEDQRDNDFIEALQLSYGKRGTESNQSNGTAKSDQLTPEKKPHHEALKTNGEKKNNDKKNAKTSPALLSSGNKTAATAVKAPSSSPVKQGDPAKGKNKPFFLAKWFGFGK